MSRTFGFLGCVAALLFVAAGPAAAQVYRCADASGRTVYSDAPCTAGRQLDPAQLRANSVEAVPTAPSRAEPARPGESPRRANAAAKPACLSDNEIRNLEVSASSIALKPVEQQLLQEDVGRAKACEPLMTEREKNALRRKLEDRELKRRALEARAARCDPATLQAQRAAASSSTAFCTER